MKHQHLKNNARTLVASCFLLLSVWSAEAYCAEWIIKDYSDYIRSSSNGSTDASVATISSEFNFEASGYGTKMDFVKFTNPSFMQKVHNVMELGPRPSEKNAYSAGLQDFRGAFNRQGCNFDRDFKIITDLRPVRTLDGKKKFTAFKIMGCLDKEPDILPEECTMSAGSDSEYTDQDDFSLLLSDCANKIAHYKRPTDLKKASSTTHNK